MVGVTKTGVQAVSLDSVRGSGRGTVTNPSEHTRTRRFEQLLSLLLLVLLSGLPQIGMSLTGVDSGSERVIPVPLTRALFLDKLPPEHASLAPPGDTAFPPLLATAAPPTPLPGQQRDAAGRAVLRPSIWFSNLNRKLYRHDSNYV